MASSYCENEKVKIIKNGLDYGQTLNKVTRLEAYLLPTMQSVLIKCLKRT